MLRKAAEAPKLIVVIGIWLMWFLPCAFFGALMVLVVMEMIFNPATFSWLSVVAFLALAVFTGIPAVLLYRTTKGYFTTKQALKRKMPNQ